MDIARKKRVRANGRTGQKISDFARRLLMEWKQLALPVAGERVIVAVSGGADSVALLLALDELIKSQRLALDVTVAHLNHGLRADAGEADAAWVALLSSELNYEVASGRADVRERAAESGDNLEQAARRARYEFLAETARRLEARIVLTAHTMDDQAETVLLRLLRGSGTEGLGGIEPVRVLLINDETLLVRPLLQWARRAETEEYCVERNVPFRVDEMNRDERFARVRVRRHLIPLMQTFNGRIVEALSRTAEVLREDGVALRLAGERLLEEAGQDEAKAGQEEETNASQPSPLRIDVLASAPRAVRRHALRQWIARGRGDLRRLELAHLLAVEKLLVGERGGRVAQLPGGSAVSRRRGRLYLKSCP